MSQHLYLLFPLGAGLLYAFAVTALKRAMADGVGPWRITFAANLIMGLVFQAPLLLEGASPTLHGWTSGFFPGLLFFLGQIFTFLALARGDVSIATPVLGTKVILVAFFTVLILHLPIPWTLWAGAVLAVAAIVLLQQGGSARHGSIFATLGYGITAAVCFALADVLVQREVPLTGFASGMFGTVTLLSFALIPLFGGSFRVLAPAAWPWLLGGSVILSVQCMLMAFAIGKYGQATAINIAYSSRGVFSVVLVWVAGHWFDNAESQAGPAAFTRRLAGAGLLLSAIVLIIL